MSSKAAKAAKIIFIISFLPASAVLGGGIGFYLVFYIFFAMGGNDLPFMEFVKIIGYYFRRSDGLFLIPVLSVCIVYQIIYSLKKIRQHEKIYENKKMTAFIFAAETAVAALIIVGMISV